MYGSVRQYKVVGGDDELNEGIGDTSAFRGRLLVSIETTILEGDSAAKSTVKREPLQRSSDVVSRQYDCVIVHVPLYAASDAPVGDLCTRRGEWVAGAGEGKTVDRNWSSNATSKHSG